MFNKTFLFLDASIFFDEKIKTIRECMEDGNNVFLVWIYLLTKAARTKDDGWLWSRRYNYYPGGTVVRKERDTIHSYLPYGAKEIAEETNIDVETVQKALKVFRALGMIEGYNLYKIVDFSKYQEAANKAYNTKHEPDILSDL